MLTPKSFLYFSFKLFLCGYFAPSFVSTLSFDSFLVLWFAFSFMVLWKCVNPSSICVNSQTRVTQQRLRSRFFCAHCTFPGASPGVWISGTSLVCFGLHEFANFGKAHSCMHSLTKE